MSRIRIRSVALGMTLLEIILALSLTVVATGLIGGLIQIYQGQLEVAKDNVRQARIARSVLTMIADDVRGVIREYQNEDAKTLESFLTASAGQNAAAGQAGGQGGTGGQTSGGSTSGTGTTTGTTGGTGGSTGGTSTTSTSTSSTGSTTTDATTEEVPPIPPGILGTDSVIEIDVSRPPRPDQYVAEIANPLEARLVDVPSDTKKVSYFVQAPNPYGVQDPLNQAIGGDPQRNSGLVRRSLDRSVTKWANEQAQTMQLSSTGEIIAPEVVALQFSYFDGLQWTPTWDSSTQGLPWAIQITIAMQHAKYAREAPIVPGTSVAALTMLPKTETGLETYSMLAVIPGVQLLKTPADKQAAADAEASATSSLGFQ
jgi:type II secretory pathway pseudopilin PulG